MSTNVQNLRDLSRWNVFEFIDNKYVPIFPFAGTWEDMSSNCNRLKLARFRACWPHFCDYPVFVILPYGCCF